MSNVNSQFQTYLNEYDFDKDGIVTLKDITNTALKRKNCKDSIGLKKEIIEFKKIMNDKGFVDLKAFEAKCKKESDIQKSWNEMVKYHDFDQDGKVSLEDFMMTLQNKTDFKQELVESAIVDFEDMQGDDGFACFDKFKNVMEVRELIMKDQKKAEALQAKAKKQKRGRRY